MKEIVIVLGAGASCPFGAPLMKDFYHVAASLFVDRYATDHLKRQFGIVFDFIDRLQKAQAKANIDLHNIESVYTALEMAQLLGLKNLQSEQSDDWEAMDRAMKYFLSKAIEARCQLLRNEKLQYNHQPGDGVEVLNSFSSPQDPLIEAVGRSLVLEKNGWTVTFLTFNYDLVLESILGKFKVATNYCLPDTQPPLSNAVSRSMKVLKLHGSINWQKKTPPNRSPLITPFPIYPLERNCFPDPDYYDVTVDNQVLTRFSEAMVTPMIVPPVWNKSNYHSPINAIWREAAVCLSRASHIYCLGYSLPQTDGFFKQLFALGTVGDRPLQQFQVFDIEDGSTPNGVHNRYRGMLGRGSENVFRYSDQGAAGLRDTLADLR